MGRCFRQYRMCVVLMVFNCALPCPVIHIDRSPGPDSAGYPRITTIIQSDQVKEIFENVTNVLLDNQEERFLKFLAVNDISRLPSDCQDVKLSGHSQSGVYTIYPKGTLQGFPVYCDMKTDHGGWTVIQRRTDGSVDFNRDWNDYLTGFGEPGHEYWFGNQQIHLLTSSAWYELRIDMVNHEGQHKHVTYDIFSISDAESGFRLFVDGFHGDGEIKDDLRGLPHTGKKFSTKDRDQDSHSTKNCASDYEGGWWYSNCHRVSLNSPYGKTSAHGIHWHSWDSHSKSMTRTEMKIRRFQRK